MSIQPLNSADKASVSEILSASGYGKKAIDYYLSQPYMGVLAEADQVTELTGHCGDTMKIYLKIDQGRIEDARIQVLGCPGAVASAMAAMEMIKGLTLKEAAELKDAQIFRLLENLPDQKQHCVRLTVKTLQKALEEYARNNSGARRSEHA
ncbi:MAG: iron-sulfur cluster assembly scaffold protein, partial [Pseudomonadota bacterium]